MKDLKVFISYRRSDTQHVAGRLGDRVSQRFRLFMDIDDIPIGVDFTDVVRRAVDESDVLLVLIGPQFLAVDQDGHRRLDRPGDWVAEEIAAGLNRDITVVPVLVDGAKMPADEDLPPMLKPLCHRQALSVSHASFNTDVEKLINALIALAGSVHSEATSRDLAELLSDPDYARATAAEFNQRWSEALELFTALDQRYPHDDRVRRALRVAQLQLAAAAAEQGGHWDEVVTNLDELVTLQALDHSIGQRLAAARTRRHIDDLSDQLRALYAAKEWAGVGAINWQIVRLDPSRANPNGLAAAAAANIEHRLPEAYLTGLRALEQAEFGVALAQFEEIQRDRPGYGASADFLKLARYRLRSAAGREHPAVPPLDAPTPMSTRKLRAVERRARREAALLGSQPWVEGRLRPTALASTGAVVAFGVLVMLLGSSPVPAYLLTVVAMFVMLAILLRDARHLNPPDASLLQRSGVLIVVVGTIAALTVAGIAKYELDATWAVKAPVVVTALGLASAAFGYRSLRRRLGRAAIWAALLLVLVIHTSVLFIAMLE